MINVLIWTEDGIEFKVEKMVPSEVKEFIQLIKDHGVWVDGTCIFYPMLSIMLKTKHSKSQLNKEE